MFQFSSLRFLSPHFFRWTSSLIFAFTAIALAAPSINLRGAVSDTTGAVIPNANTSSRGVQAPLRGSGYRPSGSAHRRNRSMDPAIVRIRPKILFFPSHLFPNRLQLRPRALPHHKRSWAQR